METLDTFPSGIGPDHSVTVHIDSLLIYICSTHMSLALPFLGLFFLDFHCLSLFISQLEQSYYSSFQNIEQIAILISLSFSPIFLFYFLFCCFRSHFTQIHYSSIQNIGHICSTDLFISLFLHYIYNFFYFFPQSFSLFSVTFNIDSLLIQSEYWKHLQY